MSQNPYGSYPSEPEYPGNPEAVSPGAQPPAASYPPPNTGAPNANYGAYNNPAALPPMPPGNYDPTVIAGRQPQGQPYAGSNPPSGPHPAVPNSGYGAYNNPPSGPYPAMPNSSYGAYNNPPTPMPPGNYDPTALAGQPANQPSGAGYPGYSSAPAQPLNAAGTVYPPSNPQAGGYQQAWPTTPVPPPPASQQAPKKSHTLLIIIVVVILVLVVGASIFGVMSYNNNQATLHANATATSQAQANANASATADVKATAAASATAVASVYPFSNNSVLKDQLGDSSLVSKYGWDNDGQYCFFANGSYNDRDPQPNTYGPCGAKFSNFANFTFQVQMTIQLGDAGSRGGVFFRGNEAQSQYYLFFLDSQGNYALYAESNSKSNNSRTLKYGQVPSSNFNSGFNAVNTIGVVARGDQISIYVNDKTTPVFQVTDSTYTTGQIGVIAATDAGGRTVTTYNAAEVWQLP